MAVTESFKIMASMWLFVRAFVKAVILYINETKAPRHNELKGQGLRKDTKLPDKLPSIIDIKRALPHQCFDPHVSTSMYYFMKDVLQVVISYAVFSGIHTFIPLSYWPTMIFYWAIQGTFFTALFVLGHDCGHGSFSHHTLLNDVIGNITHCFLLVPYYMWKLSHKHHHKNNANFERDEVFYPVKKSDKSAGATMLPGFGFGVGWFWYLLAGYKPRVVNHFNVWHAMFAGHLFQCCCTMAGLAVMSYLIYLFYLYEGVVGLVCYYLVPLFIFGSYTVVITFLHHSEMNIPWYATSHWDFVRGQLSTIDRHYGSVHSVIHNIGTHQMHHMFIKIPHYHLETATTYFRAAFPELVRTCDEPILSSFLRMFRRYDTQKDIPDDTVVHYYKDVSAME